MALDYRKCAEQIVSHIGGRENIVQAAHCATRLRLVIKDNGKVDKKALENVDGVKGMFENNGQLQLIIGTGTVNKVYAEFLSVTGMTEATKDDVKAAAAAGQPIWKRILKAIGDVFVPILPAIVASGLMMGFVEAMGKVYPEFASTSWYDFLDMVANTAFAYLPVIVAISAARVFGGNMFLGAVIGLAMIHANLVNAWVVGTLAEIPKWDFNIFNFIVSVKVGYQGHVIPVIIAVWLMCAIEKWLHKHTPEMIDLFVVPFTTVLVTTFLTFTIIGPIFSQLETWVLEGAKILVKNPIGSGVMGAIYPWTVVMGLHHMYNVIEAGMLSVEGGLNTWMPIASAANFAQFGACLAVGFKARNNRTKVVAIPSSLSAALGITEPAIFGINLRFFKPIIAGMIGGTIGAIYGAFSGIGAAAYGVTGIPGYLTIQQPVQYTILLAISGGIAFVLSWILWKEEEPEAAEAAPAPAVEEIPEKFVEFGTVISSSGGEIAQCTEGKIIPYTEIPDPTFAAGTLGQGVGIQPEDEYVYAPIDGEISSVAESKHAIGISGENDMEVLIHVGVDTVEMKGDGFEDYVKEGDKVKKGQKIMKFDREKIKAAGHPDTVVLLLTNSDDYQDVKFGANV